MARLPDRWRAARDREGAFFYLTAAPDSAPHKGPDVSPAHYPQTEPAMKRDHLDAFSLPRIDLLDSPLYSSPQPMTTVSDDFLDSGYCSDRPNTPRLSSLVPQSPYADSMAVLNFHQR